MSFIDPHIVSLKQSLEGNIDFVGQEAADNLAKQILWSSAVVGFVLGFTLQDIRVTFGIFGVGGVACVLAVLPPWKRYNSHPVSWLPEKTVEEKKDL